MGWAFGALAALVVLFALAGWIGSMIPRNGDWREPDSGVEILVESNGIHTALVLPLVTPEKDWRADFPAADLAVPGRPYTHVSVSWGEREVFLNTPTWWDLTPRTAWSALRPSGPVGGHAAFAAHERAVPPPGHGDRTRVAARSARAA